MTIRIFKVSILQEMGIQHRWIGIGMKIPTLCNYGKTSMKAIMLEHFDLMAFKFCSSTHQPQFLYNIFELCQLLILWPCCVKVIFRKIQVNQTYIDAIDVVLIPCSRHQSMQISSIYQKDTNQWAILQILSSLFLLLFQSKNKTIPNQF